MYDSVIYLVCGQIHNGIFQAEILKKVGPDALKLGLLMGTEDDPREEEQQEVLSFHHLLIMEYTAGKYVSTLRIVSKIQAFERKDSSTSFLQVFTMMYLVY